MELGRVPSSDIKMRSPLEVNQRFGELLLAI
jgi:hypothetical protein